ncbi:MAG: hypothetical protein K2Q10_14305, partial [Rhodospirillales bacterium]|nr:hypothetical protein [Rhodospirillales bacterium]
MVGFALISAALTGALAYTKASSEMVTAAENKLEALMDGRKAELQRYLDSIDQDSRILAGMKTMADAMTELNYGFNTLKESGKNPESVLQKLYVSGNPHPPGKRKALLGPDDGTDYNYSHARYHEWLRHIMETRGYRDLFLIDRDGRVIYTVEKEPDFAITLTDAQWKDGPLGQIFQRARQAGKADTTILVDFQPYAPSNGEPAGFIGAPVWNDGAFAGVLVFQLP